MSENVYTTVNVAKLCKVSLRTVIRWVDEGKLPSFRTPGGHRRVREADLMEFLDKYKIPFSVGTKSEAKKILIFDEEKELKSMLNQILRRASDVYEITQAKGIYEGGILVGLLVPDLVIMAGNLKFREIQGFCRALDRIPDTKDTKVLIMSDAIPESKKRDLNSSGTRAVVEGPFTLESIRPRLLELLGDSPLRSV